MGALMMYAGLVVIALDLFAESGPAYSLLGFGLIATGGVLHLGGRR